MRAETQGDLDFPRTITVTFDSRGFAVYVLELSTLITKLIMFAI